MKRLLEFFLALLGLLIFGGLLLFCILIAAIDTKSWGLFCQMRIGRNGKPFAIYKIKTLNEETLQPTASGTLLRKYKLDELPQIINILLAQMSVVGPRPDLPGYADILKGSDRKFLSLKPGLTGLASLKYKNEEALLAKQSNPIIYNDTVIWPDKVHINNWYVKNRTLKMDLKIMYHTLIPGNFDVDCYIKTYNKAT